MNSEVGQLHISCPEKRQYWEETGCCWAVLFLILDVVPMKLARSFSVPHSEQPIRANKTKGRIGFCASIWAYGLRPSAPDPGKRPVLSLWFG